MLLEKIFPSVCCFYTRKHSKEKHCLLSPILLQVLFHQKVNRPHPVGTSSKFLDFIWVQIFKGEPSSDKCTLEICRDLQVKFKLQNVRQCMWRWSVFENIVPFQQIKRVIAAYPPYSRHTRHVPNMSVFVFNCAESWIYIPLSTVFFGLQPSRLFEFSYL